MDQANFPSVPLDFSSSLLPRPAQPSRDSLPESSKPATLRTSSSEKVSKKRVTASACEACRRRKSRCDAARPRCSACASVYKTVCAYGTDVELSRKSSSRKAGPRALSVPPSMQDSLAQIIASLKAQPDSDAALLSHLLNAQMRLESISAANPQNLLTPGVDVSPSPVSPDGIARDSLAAYRTVGGPKDPSKAPLMSPPGPVHWFKHPPEPAFVAELIDIFFSVDNAYYHIISEHHFRQDFNTGGTQYCSSVLVHAILAMACQYYKARAQHSPADAAKARIHSELFYGQAAQMMFSTRDSSLPTVQALAIMGIHQGSSGLEEYGYRWHGIALRMALEMNMHISSPAGQEPLDHDEDQVRRLTFWSVYNLEVLFAVSNGKVAQLDNASIDSEKPSITSFSQKRDSIMPQVSKPGSHSRDHIDDKFHQEIQSLFLIQHMSELSQIANDINLTLYAPGRRVGLQELSHGMANYAAWEDGLSPLLQLDGHRPIQVFLLHMYYRQSIIQLLRPFMPYDLSQIGLHAKEICLKRATEILMIWLDLRHAYSLERICTLVNGPLKEAACAFLFNIQEPNALTSLERLIDGLHYLSTCHQYAENSIATLRELAKKFQHAALPLFDRYLPKGKLDEQARPPSLSAFKVLAHVSDDIELLKFSTNPSQSKQRARQPDVADYGQSYVIWPPDSAQDFGNMQAQGYFMPVEQAHVTQAVSYGVLPTHHGPMHMPPHSQP